MKTVCGKDVSELTDTRGRFRISVIRELNLRSGAKYESYYTMYDDDRHGMMSAKRVYLDSVDEYEAAIKLVGTWANWKQLLKSKEFVEGPRAGQKSSWEGLKSWREEKQIMDESKARELLWQAAEQGSVSAQRILYDGKKEPVGRPSKAKVKQEANRMAREDQILAEGFERINQLKLVANNVGQKDSTPKGNN